MNLEDLVKAYKIFRDRAGAELKIECFASHDRITYSINPEIFTEPEIIELDMLGVILDNDEECFYSLT